VKYVIAIQVELDEGKEQDQEAVDAAVEVTVEDLTGTFFVEDDEGNESCYKMTVTTCLSEDKVTAMEDTIDIGTLN
jgi:hypothetical protein